VKIDMTETFKTFNSFVFFRLVVFQTFLYKNNLGHTQWKNMWFIENVCSKFVVSDF
jgi:hypothetical protein